MTVYEIRIHSLLDPAWQETFGVDTFELDEEAGETRLRSTLDQAQLQGILNRIHALGLKLIAVKIIDSKLTT